MNEHDRIRRYEHLFLELQQQAGKWVVRIFIILVVLLLLYQSALHIRSFRTYISPVERISGIPVDRENVKDWQE